MSCRGTTYVRIKLPKHRSDRLFCVSFSVRSVVFLSVGAGRTYVWKVGALTSQPRATPGDPGKSQGNKALKGRNKVRSSASIASHALGRCDRGWHPLFRPFRAGSIRFIPRSPGVARGWIVSAPSGHGSNAQPQNAHATRRARRGVVVRGAKKPQSLACPDLAVAGATARARPAPTGPIPRAVKLAKPKSAFVPRA